jgi:hypothetical protein
LRPIEALTSIPEGLRQSRRVIGVGPVGVREDIHNVLTREPDDPSHLVAAIGLIDLGPVGVLIPQDGWAKLRAGDRLEPQPPQRLHGPTGATRELTHAQHSALGVLVAIRHRKNGLGVTQDPTERREVVPRRFHPLAGTESVRPKLYELRQGPLHR